MSDRPRVLTLWMDSYYMSGKGVSGERQQWGDGLFGRLGYDEHHIRLEDAGHAQLEQIIRGYAPYEFVVVGPYQEIQYWLRPMLDPGTPIVVLMSDDDWRWESFSRHWMNIADLIWTTSESAMEKYAAAKYEGALLSNWAARPEWSLPDPIRVPQRGASFCGWTYGDRMARLKEIGDAGDLTVIAHNCRDRMLTPEEYHRFTASWAFALCLTKSSQGVRQMKGRMFEPQIHGAVLVTEPMPGLEKWWNENEECVVFDSPADAQAKMKWLLDDPSRYLAMSERAYDRLLREHTWYHRFREIIRRLGKEPPMWPSLLLQEAEAVAQYEAIPRAAQKIGAIPIEALLPEEPS